MGEDKLFNPLQEYVKGHSWESTFQELFEAKEDNVDLRTDLMSEEIILINKIKMNNLFLLDKMKLDIYGEFLNSFMRLKFSLERKSRSEFVDVNRRERFDQDMQKLGNFSNIAKVKQ